MKSNLKVTVVDYGVGNVHSVLKALATLGVRAELSGDVQTILKSDALILPGVGSFRAGAEGLKRYRLVEPIREFAQEGKPVLGICLGAQLLLSEGHEFGTYAGLGVIPGQVVHFPEELQGVKVPHMGWNAIRAPQGGTWEKTAFASVAPGSDVYFVHSYYLKPESATDVLAETEYGGFRFASAVRKGNTYGVQFHPEKSGKAGMDILRGFLDCA